VRASHGDAAARLAIERQLAELLKREEATRDCKDFACRQLRIVGTSESVPALAALLTDDSLSDMARYALQLNTDPSVDKALIAALKKAQGLPLIGIINTLGEREILRSRIRPRTAGIESRRRSCRRGERRSGENQRLNVL
jgi:hypothetical protein